MLRIEEAESVRRSSALGDGCAIVADEGGVLGDCVSGRFVAGTRLSGVVVRSGLLGFVVEFPWIIRGFGLVGSELCHAGGAADDIGGAPTLAVHR